MPPPQELRDFLSLDVQPDKQAEQRRKALEFASAYVAAFVVNPSGARLLKHWTDTLAKRRTPVNASVNEYVAVEAVRAFIEDIHGQIRLSQESKDSE